MSFKIIGEEKDIEDFLSENLQKELELKFIGRQVRTPAGIIDILAKSYDDPSLYYVIELKKGEINPSSMAQVFRYTMYLNGNCSKEGKRIFVPIMIGESLSQELTKSVVYFPGDGHGVEECHYSVFYRLFSFDPRHGIKFNFVCASQRSYEAEYLSDPSLHYYQSSTGYDEKLYQSWRETEDLKDRLAFIERTLGQQIKLEEAA